MDFLTSHFFLLPATGMFPMKALLLWVPKGGECGTDPPLIQIDVKYDLEIHICCAQPLRFWCVLVTATLHKLQRPDTNSSSIAMMMKTVIECFLRGTSKSLGKVKQGGEKSV